ncbi:MULTISPECIES: beta-N-acetylhexosaminidase [unclassified Carboxylicivirga]|uniref:beta-N-acetylhexosaminidase n=1 Tax=Carboxylicivirga TaxID=1628153 RepID=UPI003D3305E4
MKSLTKITTWLCLCFCWASTYATVPLEDFLLPSPQSIKIEKGMMSPTGGRILLGKGIDDDRLLEHTLSLREQFKDLGWHWELTRQCAAGEQPNLHIHIDGSKDLPAQGYHLHIKKEQIELTGADAQGVFNGLQTLRQLIDYAGRAEGLPCLSIEDYPDFEHRGFMLDVSRDRVPRLATLFQIIDHLAAWKINQLQLYTEHTFAYQNHPQVWQAYSPYTAEDIIRIDRYCKERFIDLVPNQNALGHMERWLEHEDYQHLAELETIQPEGPSQLQRRTTLNPIDPLSMELVNGMFDELLPNFSSATVNIGGDEPWELGYGRSKAVCDAKGKGQVYVDYMSDLTRGLSKKGYRTQMWADIILHHPDQLHRLPKDLTCLVWGYRAWYPFDKNCRKIKEAGLPLYVCPGTSSWQSFIGRWPNAQINLLKAAKAGKKHGAEGYLITDWGDFGHWQSFLISYPGIMYGAGLSWALDQNQELPTDRLMSNSMMAKPNPELSKLIVELGEVYKLYDGDIQKYVNVFYDILRAPDASLSTPKLKHVNATNTQEVLNTLDNLLNRLHQCSVFNDEQRLMRDELILAAGFARHSAQMAKERLSLPDHKMSLASAKCKQMMMKDWERLLARYRELWLERNRPGGLQSSYAGFEIITECYRQ